MSKVCSFNYLLEYPPLAPGVHFSDCLRLSGQKIGVPLDDTVQQHDHPHGHRHRHSCPAEKARMAALADRPVPHLLRLDDHADRRARFDHRIPACFDPRVVPRQRGTFGLQDQGSTRKECSELRLPDAVGKDSAASDPNAVNPNSVNPGAITPEPVDPGPESTSVFPGGTKASSAESRGSDAVSDAGSSGGRVRRRTPGAGHDLVD